jgi:hypothetical protein
MTEHDRNSQTMTKLRIHRLVRVSLSFAFHDNGDSLSTAEVTRWVRKTTGNGMAGYSVCLDVKITKTSMESIVRIRRDYIEDRPRSMIVASD